MNPGQRKWWQRPWRIIPVALLFLAALGAVGYLAASKTGLKRELAAIRAKGLPTNPKELDAWYAKVPVEQNAAIKIIEAHSEFVAAGEGRDPSEISWSEIPHDASLDATTVAILRFHLDRNTKTLRLLREASKLKRSRYPTDLSRSPDVSFTHLVPAKNLAQLARWEAVYQAERGDAAAALEAFRSGFAICHTLAQEPLLISELVRLACLSIQLVGMERVINVARFDEAQLQEIIAILREAADDSRTSLHRAFIGERAFANTGRKYSFEEYEQMIGVGAFLGIAIGGGAGGGNPTTEWPEFLRKAFYYTRRGIGMHDRDHAFYMRSMGKLIEVTALDHPKFYTESEILIANLAAELNQNPIALELSRISLSSMFHSARKEALVIARLRCAEAVLQIERWRTSHNGILPTGTNLIPSVVPVMPNDPLDGQPLKYQPLESQGYRVIAVAASAKDREGKVSKSTQEIDFEILK